MEQLEISASIRKEKLIEFNQSKLTFLEGLQQFEGYNSYTEIPGTNYYLSIIWNRRSTLDNFLQSDLYKFFHGAILTLGNVKEILIKSDKPSDF